MRISVRRGGAGFSLIELMIVVAIIGLLAAIAIPTYARFQMKAKTSEAKTNLASIQTAEESYYTEYGRYLTAAVEPATIPGPSQVDFSTSATGYQTLGFVPEGRVYFSYGVAVATSLEDSGYSADAGADIDGNGDNQYWVIAKAASDGSRVTPVVGCDVSTVSMNQVTPCTPQMGQSVF